LRSFGLRLIRLVPMAPMPFFAILASLALEAAGHAFMTVPHSKNNGYPGSYALPKGEYYTTASWWLDRSYFEGDPKKTPWLKPGHFSWRDARDLYPDFQQTFHPCGCYNPHGVEFCAGVELASGFGETTMGPSSGPSITPQQWVLGTSQETAFNMYANHGGGYVYMLCKRSSFLQCRLDHLEEPIRLSSREQVDAYLECIWDCFEANVLQFAPGNSQWLEYQAQSGMNVSMKVQSKTDGTLPEGSAWRWIPIPDTAQITGGGAGTCAWDAVASFSNDLVKEKFTEDFGGEGTSCDTGPKAHNPNNWQVKDQVLVPANLAPGEYLLSWRWDCYMADQIWSNCADVEITTSTAQTTSTTTLLLSTSEMSTSSTTTQTTSTCTDSELPVQWSQAGRFDCAYFQTRGATYSRPDAYCEHAAIRDACCFCGGGRPASLATISRKKGRRALRHGTLALLQNATTVRHQAGQRTMLEL